MSKDKKRAMPKVRQKLLAPVSSYVRRQNTKSLLIVERDGSVSERISLQVPEAMLREQLICLHYLRQHARLMDTDIGANVLSRDRPWDFELQLSTGERFFLEITAIADGHYQFEADKREERLLKALGESRIQLHELRKLAQFFPNGTWNDILAEHAHAPGHLKIANPIDRDQKNLFFGHVVRPTEGLAAQIIAAVDRKVAKRHEGKDKTVLILDYRGNYADLDDFRAAHDIAAPRLADAPFPEIWIYVGYFSDSDGNNAEFTFIPFKLPAAKVERYEQAAAERGTDEYDRLIW